MKFRDDIDIGNTWVTSDSHFGHENIGGFCHRPLDYDQIMVAEWRKAVPDEATVLHLGDLCYRGNAWFKHIIAPELTGARKLLIRGNHDHQRYNFYKQCGFAMVRDFKISYSKSHVVSFSHYPDSELPANEVRLHGHIHNNGYTRDGFVPFLKNHINLSVEQTKYRPVNLRLLLDAYILGKYPQTTEQQQADARKRRDEALERTK